MKKILFKPQSITLIISIVIGLLVFFYINFIPGGKKMEFASYDFRLNLLGKVNKFDDRILIVGIDADTVEKYGFMPYPRSEYAKLIRKLDKFNPSVIAFDMVFDTKDRFSPENDKEFAKAIEESGKVILSNSFKSEGTFSFNPHEKRLFKFIDPIDIFKEHACLCGYVRLDPELDDTMRKVKLALPGEDGWRFQLQLAVVSLLEGVPPEEVRFEDNKIIIGKRIIPVNNNQEIYINYPKETLSGLGGIKYTFEPLSFYKVLEEDFTIPGEGWIFIVGGYYDELGDVHKTPHKREFGVKIQASVLNTILQEAYIYRVPAWVNLLIVLFISIVLGLLLHKFNAKIGIVITIVFLFIYLAVNFSLFRSGIWIDFYSPIGAILISFAFIEAFQFLRTYKLFQQFLPAEYVDQMLLDTEAQKLGGQEVEATVLFSDIRGYTNLSENLNPTEVMDLLNEYHTKMGKLFDKYNGRVFDYQGDAQMVVFGAVKKDENHALNAILCGLDMQTALQELVEEWEVDKKSTFEVGIGICTGPVALGYVGSDRHKQLAAIGDTTNTSARLQGMSKKLESPVTIIHKTYEFVKDLDEPGFTCEKLAPVSVKGKKEPLTVYRVKRTSKELSCSDKD